MSKTTDEMTLVMRINGLTEQLLTLQEQQQEQISDLLQACDEALDWYRAQIKGLDK